jgi:hypothetical protein
MAIGLDQVLAAAGAALVGAAVLTELSKPAGERAWHGNVAGVPYDLRPPTMARMQASLWDPNNPALLVPQVFGVGWSVNLATLARPFGLGPQAGDCRVTAVQSRSPWRMSCRPASVIEPDSDG